MSRFNVTIAVAAVCGSMILEGCKTDAAKKQEKTLEKFTKKMNDAAKGDHKFEACDAVQKDYATETASNQKDASKDVVKKYKENNKKADKDDYDKFLTACKKQEDKEEDTVEVQECIRVSIPEDKRWDLKDLKTKKETKTPSDKDVKKAADKLAELEKKRLAYAQSYATCYVSATDADDVSFEKTSDNELIKNFGQYTYTVSADKKSVKVEEPKAPTTPATPAK